MYVRHITRKFLDTPMVLNTRFTGAVLAQPGGAQRISEAAFLNADYGVKPRGFSSVYIKAAAISCGGCQTVLNYASLTCPMPLAKG